MIASVFLARLWSPMWRGPPNLVIG
jgi:hypothetical protein